MISSIHSNQPFASSGAEDNSAHTYLESAINKLRDSGLRITKSRVQLLSTLARGTEPLSVEELHSLVGEEGCDLVTIYRSMLVFEEHALVQRSFRYNGTTVFERMRDSTPRYRVFCKQSQQFAELNEDLSGPVRGAILALEEALRARGYANVTHLLEFFAVNTKYAAAQVENNRLATAGEPAAQV
jgi:Fur family ferric uptake transcriptional regulator